MITRTQDDVRRIASYASAKANLMACLPFLSDLTTGQVSILTGAAPRTVGTWIDNGHLRGWRIPNSKDRRVRKCDLLDFFKRHEMPIPAELEPTFPQRLVSIGMSGGVCLGVDPITPVDLGCVLTKEPQSIRSVLISSSIGTDQAEQIARQVRVLAPHVRIILIAGDDYTPTLSEGVFDGWERLSSGGDAILKVATKH